MPKIIQIREMDGEFWVRIERDFLGAKSRITLFTDDEIKNLQVLERAACIQAIHDLSNRDFDEE